MSWWVASLAYGYLRITDHCDDEEIRQVELGLRKLAEAERLGLIEIFAEDEAGYYDTFYELVEELRRAPVGHLVVPSLEHLSAHPLIRDQHLNQLERTNTQVWVVDAVSERADNR